MIDVSTFLGRVGRRGVLSMALAMALAAGLPATDGLAKVSGAAVQPGTFDTKADTAILIDFDSGTTLFEKNADKAFLSGAIAKLMTVAVVFDQIKAGTISLTTEYQISEHSWRTGGAPARSTTMFAPINSRVKVSDLLLGVIVQSANDGAITLAEGIAGNELAFADLMNQKAAEIGLTKSTFHNPAGMPDPDQKVSARDMAKIAQYIISNHPELYRMFAQREFTFNNIRQQNRNTLLNDSVGADGLIVGGTKESGSHIVGSAVQGGQRLILVLSGVKTDKERAEEARKLIDWGFRTFETITLFNTDEVIGEASVYGGAKSSVTLKAKDAVKLLVQKNNRGRLTARVTYTGPLKAPLEPGKEVGQLVVLRDGQPIQETPVYTAEPVGLGTLRQRATDAVQESMVVGVRKLFASVIK